MLMFQLFCFHLCSFLIKNGYSLSGIYSMLLCLLISMGSMWFLWLNVSVIDNFTSVTDVASVYFITLSQQKFILFLLHFFTLNHNYLTVFRWYLCWWRLSIWSDRFICFIFCFLKIYFLFEPFLFIIVTSYCIIYYRYLYILVHMTLNYFSILSHILHWVVIILKKVIKEN